MFFVYKPQIADVKMNRCPFHRNNSGKPPPGGRCGCFDFMVLRDKTKEELTGLDISLITKTGMFFSQLSEEAHG